MWVEHRSCVSAYQWLSPFQTSCFDGLYPNPEYLCSQSSQICQVLDTDQKNASITIGAAPISTRTMSWSTNGLPFIMREIIKSKGLLKSVQLWGLLKSVQSWDNREGAWEGSKNDLYNSLTKVLCLRWLNNNGLDVKNSPPFRYYTSFRNDKWTMYCGEIDGISTSRRLGSH